MNYYVAFAFFEIVAMAAGFLLGRKVTEREGLVERQHDNDSDLRIYIPMRDRDGGGDNGPYIPTSEEIETVLYCLRLGASDYERQIIDYLIDKEEDMNERDRAKDS